MTHSIFMRAAGAIALTALIFSGFGIIPSFVITIPKNGIDFLPNKIFAALIFTPYAFMFNMIFTNVVAVSMVLITYPCHTLSRVAISYELSIDTLSPVLGHSTSQHR